MSNWYEVFDNEVVLWHARERAAHISVCMVIGTLITTGTTIVGIETSVSLWLVGAGLVTMWGAICYWAILRTRQLQRLLWCIKLSEERVVGYDYTRQKVMLEWSDVENVDINEEGMVLVGLSSVTLSVSKLFPNFAELSHRVMYYAEKHQVPIYVDGHPWQSLDVYELFPFLTDSPSADYPS